MAGSARRKAAPANPMENLIAMIAGGDTTPRCNLYLISSDVAGTFGREREKARNGGHISAQMKNKATPLVNTAVLSQAIIAVHRVRPIL